ncbi:MAG TPA: glycosyltransferase [Micromonosporaceae bacterium]
MRFLVAQPGPAFSVQDVYVGWVEALKDLGHTAVEFNLDRRLAFYSSAEFEYEGERRHLSDDQVTEMAINGLCASLYKVRPDVLLVVSGFFVPLALMDLARKAYGTRVVVLHTESPYEDDRQLQVAEHADLNLLNDPTNIDQFKQVSRAVYMPHAYRPTLHCPGPAKPELVCDLGFVGTGYQSRVDFFESMDLDGLDVLLGGNWQLLAEDSPLRKYLGHDIDKCLDNEETVDLYRSARVGINLYRRESRKPELSQGWAMGPREVEMAACGAFFLRDSRPEGDELLPMLPRFSSPAEASELLRWWLAHDRLRRDAAEAARVAVQNRTFTNHAKQLLRLLET